MACRDGIPDYWLYTSLYYTLISVPIILYVFYYRPLPEYHKVRKRDNPSGHRRSQKQKEAVSMLKKFLEFIEEYYEEFSHSEKW